VTRTQNQLFTKGRFYCRS